MTIKRSRQAPPARRILVDLTPLLPRGESGGLKPLIVDLLGELARLDDRTSYLVAANEATHDELAPVDRENAQRIRLEPTAAPGGLAGLPALAIHASLAALGEVPDSVAGRLRSSLWSALRPALRPARQLHALGVNLVFSPLLGPWLYGQGVPSVALVPDLQYIDWPSFFRPDNRRVRRWQLEIAGRHASRIVTISDHVRASLLDAGFEPGRVERIYPVVNAPPPDPNRSAELLRRLGLTRDGYLVYPANVWPHKNHRRLVAAFRSYLARNPGSPLRLVLTGAEPDSAVARELRGELDDRVLWLGYVPAHSVSDLLANASALTFPSLYEGFGMPVLHALQLGKPVLCSRIPSLVELAGDTAIFFDPADVKSITAAIQTVTAETAARFAAEGPRRAARFGTPTTMASEYLRVFEAALARETPG